MFHFLSFNALRSRFIGDRSGNIGIMFAMTVLPVLLAVSLTIDFVRASDEKAKMDAAIDAAALYAVTTAATKPAAKDYNAEALAAQKYFTVALGTLPPGVSVTPIAINVTKDPKNPSAVISTATYNGSIKTLLGDLFHPSIAISGSASATTQIPSYIDFYLLLDNSPSMGLAATQADINKLVSLTPDKCEFACHVVDANGKSDPNDYLSIALKNGVKLRIDSLREATQALTKTAQTTQQKSGLNNQFRMGVYAFTTNVTVLSGSKQTTYSKDNGLIADLIKVGNSAGNLQLSPYRSDSNFFLTDFVGTLASMNKIVSDPGDGSKASTPEKFVFFVTDGVQDLTLNNPHGSKEYKYTQYDNTNGWGHAIAPIDPTICQPLKNRGIKIAVLYTPFLATSAGVSPLSDRDIVYWKDDIPVKLQACASPGFYYQADSAGIAAAMNQMFQDALRSARLTQ